MASTTGRRDRSRSGPTNDRSIFSSSTGDALEPAERRVAGAEVVDREPHPELPQGVQGRVDLGVVGASGPSVISRVRRPARGGTAGRRPTAGTGAGSWSWRVETLTATPGGGPSGRSACQRRRPRQASGRTQAPTGTISPVSSAMAMNSTGRSSSPRLRSRSRASAPTNRRRPGRRRAGNAAPARLGEARRSSSSMPAVG